MAKKKKANDQAQQKILAAQHRNDFLRKLKSICALIAGEGAYDLIPKNDIEIIYKMRGAMLKVLPKEGCKVKKELIDYISDTIKNILQHKTIELWQGGPSISYTEYFTIGITLEVYLSPEGTYFAGKERFVDNLENFDRINIYSDDIIRMTNMLSIFCSDMTNEVYCIEYFLNPEDYPRTDNRIYQVFKITPYSSKKRYFKIDEITRPAFRVMGVLHHEYTEIEVPTTMYNNGKPIPQDTMLVYIQQHALNRLVERMMEPVEINDDYDMQHGILQFSLIESLQNRRSYADNNGKILIEFRLFEKKAGYLVGDAVDDVFLIRTFLFLTNTGTPEGKQLEELTGLKKLDKKYWAIDQLPSLLKSDILENEEACEMFKNAGCESLLELIRILNNGSLWSKSKEKISLAFQILDYIQKDKDMANTIASNHNFEDK